MGRKQGPRKGSMQFWPRKKCAKLLPEVNWNPITQVATKRGDKPNILGFIGYKAGMASAFLKDNSADSMMKGKRIILPVTIVECPPMRILSVRFYKGTKVLADVLNDNLDKDLKRIIRLPNSKNKKINAKEMIEKIEKEKASEITDVQLLLYTEVKKTELKKTPDISEIAMSGNLAEKIHFAKEHLAKEISVSDVFTKGMVDIRGLTKGKGFQGAVKRFGVRFRVHKAEKGQRKVGSIGAWHPHGVRFTVPRPGGMGMFSRISHNLPLIASKKITDNDSIKKRVFANYGMIKTDYVILSGSVQGSQKRQIILTSSFRPSKKQIKKQYELLELR